MEGPICNKVLFVDDDPDDLLLIREILESLNVTFEIREAHNGKEALECLERSYEENSLPCLIVLDVNMPVLDGKQTLAILKGSEKWKNIPVVVFTTSNSSLDKLYFERYRVEMITKPPSYTQLQSAVKRLLHIPASQE